MKLLLNYLKSNAWWIMVTLMILLLFLLFGMPNLFTQNTEKERIQEKTLKELVLAEKDSKIVRNDIIARNPYLFIEFQSNTSYPYLIYKKDKLVYWSNHKVVVQLEEIAKQNQKLLTIGESKFLVSRHTETIRGQYFTIAVLIELKKVVEYNNSFFTPEINTEIFPNVDLDIFEPKEGQGVIIKNTLGEPIFKYSSKANEQKYNPDFSLLNVVLILLALILFSVVCTFWFYENFKTGKHLKVYLVLFNILVLLGLAFYYSRFPEIVFDKKGLNYFEIKDSFFKLSFISQITNYILLLIFLLIAAYNYTKSHLLINVTNKNEHFRRLCSVILVLTCIYISYFSAQKIESLFGQEFYKLGSILNLSFSKVQILSISYFLIVFGIFFLVNQICCHLFILINKSNDANISLWMFGTLLGIIMGTYIYGFSISYIIGGLYFLILYLLNTPKHFLDFRFQSLAYFAFACFVFSILTISKVNIVNQKREVMEMQKFGERYLINNDFTAEKLLKNFEVKSNTEIKAALVDKEFGLEKVNRIIKDSLLDPYLDIYQKQLWVTDENGLALGDGENQIEVDSVIEKLSRLKPISDNFYFKENPDETIEYLSVHPLDKGQLILSLKQNDASKKTYILKKGKIGSSGIEAFNFAILNKFYNPEASFGDYNYQSYFPKSLYKKPELLQKGMVYNGYKHLLVKKNQQKMVLVSQVYEPFFNTLTNFSFVFFILVLGTVLALLVVYIFWRFRFQDKKVSFGTKIQLYINASLLIPFILLIIITLSLVKATISDLQNKSLMDGTKSFSEIIQPILSSYKNQEASKSYFENTLNNQSESRNIDFNIFNKQGELEYSSNPLMFESTLFSKFINPKAIIITRDRKESQALLTETVGSLEYESAYVNLKNTNNNTIGILHVPNFDSKMVLNGKVKRVSSLVLILFLIMFILLLIGSYFISQNLSKPLRSIAQRLNKTKLENVNEELVWNAKDEIGMLTVSYNDMIKKLEESKNALSESEKQTAWREMAKQVAHEIKNPLTPMKLSIQQLQRTLNNQQEADKDKMVMVLNSLNNQIDNLSEIVNSFSEFAKMPVPKSEIFDMAETAKKTVDLYKQNYQMDIQYSGEIDNIVVRGDQQFFSRVITNIILNGIQSVPITRKPEIEVHVLKGNESGIVMIKDNGIGISHEIRDKVFISNFSTKVAGSGLGLAMAKKGIEHAGGNIWFETEEMKGTSFYIDLPIV